MTSYFFDSSALAKRYLAEIGSDWVQLVTIPSAGNRIFIAQITPVELFSVLARKQRDKNISSRTMRAAMLYVERHVHREYRVLRLQNSVEDTAKRLLIGYTLRAYDSIQLASALVIHRQLTGAGLSPVTFVCNDKRLLAVAIQEGLLTDDPDNHP